MNLFLITHFFLDDKLCFLYPFSVCVCLNICFGERSTFFPFQWETRLHSTVSVP